MRFFRVYGISTWFDLLLAWGVAVLVKVWGQSPRKKRDHRLQRIGGYVLKIFRCLEYILFFFPTPGQLRAPGFTLGYFAKELAPKTPPGWGLVLSSGVS